MWLSEESMWDEYYERTAAPYSKDQEHRDWHTVNGPYGCPWDVAACYPDEEWEPFVSLVHPVREAKRRAVEAAERIAEAEARGPLFGTFDPPF